MKKNLIKYCFSNTTRARICFNELCFIADVAPKSSSAAVRDEANEVS